MKPLILLRPHTHAGKAYSTGDRLDLPTPTAHWLIDHGIARPADDAPSSDARQRHEDGGTDVTTPSPKTSTTQRHIKDTKP
ncbi:MAG: hypothetical protein R3F04_03055 [Lysobacteraceae bacterium]